MADELKPCPCKGNLNYPTHTTECLDRQDSECALYTRAANPRGGDDVPQELKDQLRGGAGTRNGLRKRELQAKLKQRDDLLLDALSALALWQETAPNTWHMDRMRAVGKSILTRAEAAGITKGDAL